MAGDRVRTAGFKATPAAKTALRLGDHHDQGRAPCAVQSTCRRSEFLALRARPTEIGCQLYCNNRLG